MGEESGPGTRYDWESARTTFVEGMGMAGGGVQWLNLREVAEHHGIPYTRVRQHAAMHNWTEARATFQSQMEQARYAHRATEAANQARALDEQALLAAKVGLGLIGARLGEILKMNQGKTENPDLDTYTEPLDARELATLARAAGDFRDMGSAALGYPTGRTAVEISGPNGQSVRTDIREELSFDDPTDSRLTRIVESLAQAGLIALPRGEGEPAHVDDPPAASGGVHPAGP